MLRGISSRELFIKTQIFAVMQFPGTNNENNVAIVFNKH